MAITEQERRRQQKQTDLVLLFIFYLIGAYYSIHMGAVAKEYTDFNVITQLDPFLKEVSNHIREDPFYLPSQGALTPLYLFSLLFLVVFAWYLSTRKKLMPGKEHGTAKWSDKNSIRRIMDRKNLDQNIILTATEWISLNARKIRKNLNVLVVGDSGAGKSRFFIKPNIMQLHTSYVTTDTKGDIIESTGSMLEKKGFTVKVFNLLDMAHSCCYSPFKYIKEDEDVLKMITCLIKNTTPPKSNTSDPFWEKAETALLQALCFFIYYKLPEEEQNFTSVMRLLRLAKVDEEDPNFESDLDLLFKKLEQEEPENIAVIQYAIFKDAAGKTAKSILISVGVRLAAFNLSKVANLTHKDTLELEKLPEGKVALFILIPDSDTTFNFLAAMLYAQLFLLLTDIAFKSKKKRLKNHVRLLLDEFANIGEIPDFVEQESTMRSKNFSVAIMVQNITQFEKHYKDSWKTIVNNCNTKLYLGGDEKESTKYISEMLGKETIDVKTNNVTRGRQRSIAENYQKIARALMEPDEIGRMPDDDCLLFIKGMNPWYSQKFDITKHKNYGLLYDEEHGAENYFDYRRFVTPERPKTQKLNVQEVKKTEKSSKPVSQNYSIRDLEVNINSINKLRYATEFEIF